MTEFLDTPDGRIAFDREGSGPPIYLVDGAFQFRAFDTETVALAKELASRGFTVINYDRPGRGESGGTAPFTLSGEIAALRALTDAFGAGTLYGSSSGACISLAAAADGVPVTHLVLWEAPLRGDDEKNAVTDLMGLRQKLEAGDLEQAVLFFMKDFPPQWIEMARQGPGWPIMCQQAPSLEPDTESVAWTQSGPSRRELWEGIHTPALVLTGEQTMPIFTDGAESIVNALEDARYERIAGANHRWDPDAMLSAITAFVL